MNTVSIVGNLTGDAEVRHTQSGIPVTTFSVASNDGAKDKQKTVFFRVSLWREHGEKLAPYLTKGTLVMVVGSFDSEPHVWQAKDGTHRASLEITGQRVRLLGGGQRQDDMPTSIAGADEVPW